MSFFSGKCALDSLPLQILEAWSILKRGYRIQKRAITEDVCHLLLPNAERLWLTLSR